MPEADGSGNPFFGSYPSLRRASLLWLTGDFKSGKPRGPNWKPRGSRAMLGNAGD